MTIRVKIGDAKTRLSALLERVEAGEEVVISRGDAPIAKLVRLVDADRTQRTIRAIIDGQTARARTTVDEILAWREEGRVS